MVGGGSTNSVEEVSYHHPLQVDAAAMDIHLQQQLAFSNEIINNTQYHTQNQNQIYDQSNPNWVNEIGIQDMGFINPDHQQLQIDHNSNYNQSSIPETQTPEILNLFHHLPRCSASSLLPNSSISFSFPMGETNASSYDPLYHLQPPLFRELFQSLPNGGYTLPGSLFGGAGDDQDQRDQHDAGDGSVLEFNAGDIPCVNKRRGATGKKHFATERDRRENLNLKYKALQSLVPNPTKGDRASIVGDAIEYIKELLRTVNELTLLVEKKRCSRERSKRHKTEDDPAGEVESCNMKPLGGDGSLRSSWLQRKFKETEVDVRIIDDEVTIKLVQRKINCLLLVSKVLDELQLDLHHVAGGHVGDYYSFLFNSKICEGSSVYASAVANKLLEVVDRQYAAIPPSTSY
ncbi:transcription factor bHLH91-like [Tripterygium wilfordii]|nr:transcription factor bHLH91-like [Tripterygium wilfordii]